jgi:hypothetical protein
VRKSCDSGRSRGYQAASSCSFSFFLFLVVCYIGQEMNEQDLLLLLLLPYVKAYEHNSRSRNYKIEEELARKKEEKND